MSGTSLDAVDGILARFPDEGRARVLTHASLPLPRSLRDEFLALNRPGNDELRRAALAANALADLYADVVVAVLRAAGLAPADIGAVGAHGQTVRHAPEEGYTWQLNAPARLAERAGIAVVADFRSRDVAAGGQGAPLVPAFHQAVFAGEGPRVLLNLGGIANVSLLPGRASPTGAAEVGGFDTGPANMLLDLWCQRHLGLPFDRDGAWAASGQPRQALCAFLYDSEPWFAAPPPKSTGRDRFHVGWLDERLADYERRHGAVTPADVQATLLELTARSAAEAIRQTAAGAREVYVCGGGAANPVLMAALARYLPDCALQSTAALGVPPQQVEALAFAWLARAHLLKLPGNVTAVTGAAGPRVLGALYPA
ncbi:MAG: anhydro-N-acetylmuramic acid kinase [Pigmentiphaga sp.]|nr:anhydro-N-acetylmuramic acid kinase [Pigmentiphaga sp.]